MLEIFTQQNYRIPIWFMRQAGRYLPEYKEVRQKLNNFLDLCYNPQKASQVTLQPINRFGFDFAIIFSDILVLPHALGWQVQFEEKQGPILKQFTCEDDLNNLNHDPQEKLSLVYEAIERTKSNLPKTVPLIGFSGSPWTIMSYLLEGRGKQDFSVSKSFIYQNKGLTKKLIYHLSDHIADHLINQVKSGADLLQMFDSWAGVLSGDEYKELVIKPTSYIVSKVKEVFPQIKIIGFPRGSGFLYEDYIKQTGVDAIGVDQFVPVEQMRKWQDSLVVQGNIDPVVLLTSKDEVRRKADVILSSLEDKNFIFNLGHGILPNTPIENVEFLVNYVKEFRK